MPLCYPPLRPHQVLAVELVLYMCIFAPGPPGTECPVVSSVLQTQQGELRQSNNLG